MAENSETSQMNARKPIKKTKTLTPAESLEIFQQAAINLQKAGIIMKVSCYVKDNTQAVIFVVENVMLAKGHLVLADAGNEQEVSKGEE